MLKWATPFHICCFLDSHQYADHLPATPPASAAVPPHSSTAAPSAPSPPFQCLLAAGAHDSLTLPAGHAFSQLKEWALSHPDWLFGHFGYGLTRETEPTPSAPPVKPSQPPVQRAPPLQDPPPPADPIGFPDLFFFVPETVIRLQENSIEIGSLTDTPESIWRQIREMPPLVPYSPPPSIPPFIPRFTREEYINTIQALREHILRGDCYEINFCQEFFSRPARINPLSTWQALGEVSPNPFSVFYRLDDRYLFCASPERYLKKQGRTLFSQPIKGTSPRYPDDSARDQTSREELYNSPKDRSENVMVVDLVRNDLSRVCIPGSVHVPELYGVYAFPQVYQMISTITGLLPDETHWTEAIGATFPMGSMTGAPKHRVVGLIARYERSSRGLFSGAVGYVTPEGDFDFNVVIRSLFYQQKDEYLSYQVGSGITFYSDPAAEYEECLVKAAGIKKALGF